MSGALIFLMSECNSMGYVNPKLELTAVSTLDGSRYRLTFERLDLNDELSELTKEIFGNERDNPGKDSGEHEKTGR